MHAVSHSLVHRGPGATRPRPRWQPYASTSVPSLITSRVSPAPYLNTPASSVSSSPPVTRHVLPVCHPELSTGAFPAPAPFLCKESSIRDLQKSKYVTALVDQAIKSLCEIWHPQDVPSAFCTSTRNLSLAASATSATFTSSAASSSQRQDSSQARTHRHINTQLPSPVTPSTEQSPLPTPAASPAASQGRPHPRCDAPAFGAHNDVPRAAHALVPMKGFVHEVLRRSKTSATVLQTALCYIEAVRDMVPELVQMEKDGLSTWNETGADSRIIQGEEDLADGPTGGAAFRPESGAMSEEDPADTIQLQDDLSATPPPPPPTLGPGWQTEDDALPSQYAAPKPKALSAPLAPLPPLPSPLLCPRRTFLASIILASKFTQDKSYSNRAWAKLSGLPAREIGRCERALGAALDWRLWVGKLPPVASGRLVARSRSENDVFASASTTDSARTADLDTAAPASGRKGSTLRRHATVPSNAYSDADSAFAQHWAPSACAMELNTDSRSEIAAQVPAFGPGTVAPQGAFSPTNLTPTLSYSPTSTDSMSSADDPTRTIQMAQFTDLDVASPFATRCNPAGSDFLAYAGVPQFPAMAIQSGRAYGAKSMDVDVGLRLPERLLPHGVLSCDFRRVESDFRRVESDFRRVVESDFRHVESDMYTNWTV